MELGDTAWLWPKVTLYAQTPGFINTHLGTAPMSDSLESLGSPSRHSSDSRLELEDRKSVPILL